MMLWPWCVMSYNVDKVISSSRGCQVPVSPLVAEAVRLGFVVVSRQYSIPWVHLLTVNSDKAISGDFRGAHGVVSDDEVSEDARVEAFREYRSKLADKVTF